MASAVCCELATGPAVAACQSYDARSDVRSPAVATALPVVGSFSAKHQIGKGGGGAALSSASLLRATSAKHIASLCSSASLFHLGAAAQQEGVNKATRKRLTPVVAALDDDQPSAGFESEEEEKVVVETGEGGGATAVAVEASPSDKVAELKSALIDALYATDRGLRASSETRAEIMELITQLEALNPTPSPTESLALLDGKWILAYTSFSEIFPLLAASNLPLIKVGEISQTIDASGLTVQNLVTFSSPLATTSFGASASFEVRSPKRVQIKFEESSIGTPQLTDFIDLPSEIALMGQNVDLTPLRSVIKPVQEAAQNVAKSLAERPPLKIPLRDGAASWLITTYLDADLRISRGDGNSVFVLIKEGSPLLDML
ncbi:hypothetical protein CBR_g49209 [Chara braunii]|uniref:Plastid lipid-associated protein/fibrillin conserved domain-containing protein n=1 Tax=Chara braunii TaxID=69332 RepID=A0A388M499_CHABU|nr:hypothetical protein CBR_g49209 [Chara braunii]|eukprot:GBG89418.1 hypothetical protein CBR_g49209 [Chara braunii]